MRFVRFVSIKNIIPGVSEQQISSDILILYPIPACTVFFSAQQTMNHQKNSLLSDFFEFLIFFWGNFKSPAKFGWKEIADEMEMVVWAWLLNE